MDIIKRKRGRPRKHPIVEPVKVDPIVEMLMEMKEQRKVQNEMMLQMLRLAQSNQDLMTNWFKMFQPSQTPNQSTSLNQREMPDDEGQWEQIRMDEVAKMFTEEGLQYQERMMNN